MENKPVTIYLDGKSRDDIDSIAVELGISRSAAVRVVMREKRIEMFPAIQNNRKWSI